MATLVKKELPVEVEALSHRVIGLAIEVHRVLGPGLLESVYEDALVYELREAGLRVVQQAEVAIAYKGTMLRGQRLDLVVEGLIIVELKAVQQVLDVHAAQLLSYLRAGGLPLGLLLNFNVILLKEGLRRVFNERAQPIPAEVLSSLASRTSRPSR